MSAFSHLTLGQPIPARHHAVSCSLPTMRDVIGYEERDPAIVGQLGCGYPRFLLHADVRELTAVIANELGLDDRTLWLTCSPRLADALAAELGTAGQRINHDGLDGVAHGPDPDRFNQAKSFLQNVGGFLSSREAEDRLVARGLRPAVVSETLAPADTAAATIREVLTQAYDDVAPDHILLAPSGMNAFHAGWRTLADLQLSRGRTVWIQLGWLYLDTIAQLQRFAASPDDYVQLTAVHDLVALDQAIAAAGDRFAGLVTELPTNPLVQTADIAAVSAKVHAAGGRVVLDPTLVSPLNVRVLAHADLVINSLTKYAANEGDVLAGAIIINPAGADAAWLRSHIPLAVDPVYPRDLARLAAQIGDYAATVAQSNRNAAAVVAFLRNHPGVRDLYWTLQPDSAEHYLRLAHSPAHIGGMISFTVHQPLATFYDALRLPKGPSFGMTTTLICPFIYLAHYNLVTSAAGRTQLAAAGIDPDLLRLSVGTEPAEDIIAALAEAFAA